MDLFIFFFKDVIFQLKKKVLVKFFLLSLGKISPNEEMFLKISKPCYRDRSLRLEVFHKDGLASQEQTVRLTSPFRLDAAAAGDCIENRWCPWGWIWDPGGGLDLLWVCRA